MTGPRCLIPLMLAAWSVGVGAAEPAILEVPLAKSAEIKKSGYVGHPRAAIEARREGSVIAHVVINESGGVVRFGYEDGSDPQLRLAVDEALRRSRFAAPVAESMERSHELAHGCAPWFQTVRLEYQFSISGDNPRVDLIEEYAATGQVSSAVVDQVNAWMDARSGSSEKWSKGPGSTDLIPTKRVEPQFEIKAFRVLEATPMLNPMTVRVVFLVDVDGEVIETLAPGEDDDPLRLRRAAIKAVKAWEFKPATVDGNPVRRTGCQLITIGTE